MPLNVPQPEETPPTFLPAGTASDDHRYHVVFSDKPDEETSVDSLGLMLTENGPAGFGIQMTSPFAGQLGGQGNREDKDLSRWTVRSQSDWRGGRGLLTAYADTDRFYDSLADTRFVNQATLPPMPVRVGLAVSTDPEHVPATTYETAQQRISADWTARTASNQIASATVALAAGTDPEFSDPDTGYVAVYYRARSGGPSGFTYKTYCQGFTPSTGTTLSSISLKIAKAPGVTVNPFTISVFADDGTGNSPASIHIPDALWSHAMSAGECSAVTDVLTWTTFSGAGLPLTGNTKYWIVVAHNSTFYPNELRIAVAAPNYSGGGIYWAAHDGIGTQGADTTVDMIFRINNGAAGTNGPKTRVRLAQSFSPLLSKTTASVRVNLARITWAAGSTCTVAIYSNSGSSPGTSLASGTVTMPTDTNASWVTVSMAVALNSGTTYWIVVTADATTVSDNISLTWTGSASGVQVCKYDTEASGLWAGWTQISNTQLHMEVTWTSGGDMWSYQTRDQVITSYAQSFTTHASNVVTPTKIRAMLQLVDWAGAAGLTVAIYTNSGGLPSGLLYSATLTQSTFVAQQATESANWVEVAISGGALTVATTYWIVFTPSAPAVGDRVIVDWQISNANNFAGGSMAGRTQTNASGSWAASSANFDGYFIINNGAGSSSSVTSRPVAFEGAFYVAAGTGVYKWNTGTSKFDLVFTGGGTVTALCAFGGSLYAALGDSVNMQSSPDGASWGVVADRAYTRLRAYNGFLYCAKAIGGTNALVYTADASTWASVTLANSSVGIADLIGFNNELVITATTGMYALSSAFVYQVCDFSAEAYSGNGVNSLTWMADGRLYVAVGQSLHAWDGVRLTPVGLDLDQGLPPGQQGRVSCLAGSRTFLYASVDAGTLGTSGVYCYNGKGWHCLALASAPGRRIRAIGLEQVTASTSRPRIWYWEGGNPVYMELPDLTDNPLSYTDANGLGGPYAATGWLTTCWMGGELSAVDKDYQSVILRSSGCTVDGAPNVDVFIEVDRSGVWLFVGTVDRSPVQELRLVGASWSPKVIAYSTKGSTTESLLWLAEETVADLAAGQFIRVNNEIRQISSIGQNGDVLLVSPLSTAPALGDTVYPARPAGKEIRVKLGMNSKSSYTTVAIHRISVRYQEALISKFRFSLTVRIEEGMRLRGSNAQAYPLTSANLRAALYGWVRRTNPFYMRDPGGVVWKVKVTQASESGFTRTSDTIPTQWRSQMSMTLDEV